MTKPSIIVKRGFSESEEGFERGVTSNPTYRFSFENLNRVWGEHFVSNLDCIANDLWQVLSCNLQRLFELYQSWDKTSEIYDPISFQRSAIEDHTEDKFPKPSDFLINGLRDILDFYLEEETQKARNRIERLSEKEFLLFRRMAVYGVHRAGFYSSDEKLNWLLDQDLILTGGVKHEVFQLLKENFDRASSNVQRKIDHEINQKTESKLDEPDLSEKRIRSIQYEKYNILYWLNKHASDRVSVKNSLNEIKNKYPNFEPREYPDLSFYSTSRRSPVSEDFPYTKEDLLDASPEKLLEKWVQRPKDESEDLFSSDLLSEIQKACEGSFDWSISLGEALKSKEAWALIVWRPLIKAWENLDPSSDEWSQILEFLRHSLVPEHQPRDIAQLLYEGVKDEKHGLSINLVEKADNIAMRMWENLASQERESKTELKEGVDWVSKAINHPSGDIAKFWMHAISRSINQEKNGLEKIPQTFEQRLENISQNNSVPAKLGQVIIAGGVNYLHSLDSSWTEEYILPLFNLEENPNKAERAWQGFLQWGKISQSIKEELKENYKSLFQRIEDFFPRDRYRKIFSNHIVHIAIHHSNEPLEEWIMPYIRRINEENRKEFIGIVKRYLENMETTEKEEVWNSWLKNYWNKRNENIPIDFSPEEAGVMAALVLELEPVLEEAVGIFKEGPDPIFDRSFIFFNLKESELLENHPEAMSDFIIHATNNHESLQYPVCSDLKEIGRILICNGAPEDRIEDLLNNMVLLGCQGADEIRNLLEENEN